MTTPEATALAVPGASPGDLAHADLVGRLAREIYGQGQAASQPFAPTLPAGPQVPQALDSVPQGFGGAPLPSGAVGVPSAPAAGLPAGIQPDLSALGARAFGASPAGVPGLTGPGLPNLAPAGPAFAGTATIPPVHPVSPLPALPDISFPGGPELHRQVAADHPRAQAFAHALAPHLVPADPSQAGVDEAQESFRRTGRLSRAPEPAADNLSDYYFLTLGPRPARTAPATPRVEPSRAPGPAPRALSHGSIPVAAPFDVASIRRDFPALHQSVNGHPLVWLDNAATTHKPKAVIDATNAFYARHNSNIHRAAHTLAARATDLFEGGREAVRRFLNAPSKDDIVFLRGTTEAINLVAHSYGRAQIGPGDEIIVSTIEHHANIVPWQMLAQQTGATLRAIPVNDRGEIIFEQYAALLSGRTKIVSVTQVANALGTVNPVREIIQLAHAYGVPVLVDAAQSAPHMPLDVQALDADFLVFSGHKVFGPTGIGALYGKAHLLAAMPPWQGGGHMIEDVTFAKTVYKGAPEKFEAGTPDIAGAVGLGAALDYLARIGLPAIAAYEHDLLDYAQAGLADVKGLRLIGTAREKASVMSFVIEGQENEAVAHHLDARGIAVRSGHHCALPALRRFGVDQSVRASLAFYNTRAEVDAFLTALHTLPRH
ncbi:MULTISPECIES: family 2A encapsulin nanocompartment cargo protein cysteine desulfurase [unclassified Methylobacterium]|uniref:family 2A encapsulin nanocompartment cargo protein cysteine desulfurase n=1 Tax=unclassified Methylobacterium TaxID=2615210 RepID=UPI0005B8DA28|nr:MULTISPECIES: family 2A encapsulin nanocompartment cargo protein cysteine desulfurase [unclassified Methylobacterium]SFU73095.1 cysteine desulfurase / selenocysteine lyase [Methylobacterium sp. UNCCL125]